MSSCWKPKPRRFGSDIHRLLQAAEAGQKVDILTYSSGHLGPHSLNRNHPHGKKQMSFWRMSQTPNPPTLQQTRQTKTVTNMKQQEVKPSLSEFSTGAASKQKVLRSSQVRSTQRREVTSLPKIVNSSSNSLLVQPKVFSHKQSGSLSDSMGKHQFCSSQSERGLNNESKRKMKQGFGREVMFKPELWAGRNVAEMHERKLQKELKKLSAQSWPSRDRLAVFSDVFDDVCEGSPVFGRILREIKTDYDLYVNHMMSSHSPLLDMLHNPPLKDPGNVKVREEELKDAEKEVCLLEEEARKALEENKRVHNELKNVPAIISPGDSALENASASVGCAGSIQSRRLQVLSTWREIQQLEEEIEQKLASIATTTETERRIKDTKADIMRLIVSNNRLRTINKDLEHNINTVLSREKASKAMRRMLWDEIHGDLQTE